MEFPRGQTLRHTDFIVDDSVTCDAVVIGSGAGGAAVARVLAAANWKVLVLEEGRKFEPHELSTKPSWAYRNLYSERNTRVATGNLYLPLTGGRAVGGSTLLNSAICFRAPKSVLDNWREAYGLSWADEAALSATFREVESAIGVMKTQPFLARGNNLIFKAGADALGMKGDFISRNAPGCIGCGLCQLGCPVGGKGSVDRNLIPMALDDGAALFTSVRASRLILDKGRAVGVEAEVLEPLSEKPIRRLTINASKVFLCGGAIGSAHFLMRQNLANSSGQLGKHLHVHTATGMCARFEQKIDAWDGVTQGYYVMLENSIIETFSATPDIYYTQYEAFSKPIETLRHIASAGVMVGDVSAGEVKPGEGHRSQVSYSVNDTDKRHMMEGLWEIGRAYFAAGALEVHPGIHGAGTAKNMNELGRLLNAEVPASSMGIYASHPMGTCRMGANKKEGVVKPSGETWDIENLYITDGSIFPTALGVNPQVTIMTAAMTLARGVLAKG